MRPEILFPLFASTTSLVGIGPRIGKLIEKVAGPYVIDLLWHFPSNLIDRRFSPKIEKAPPGVVATLIVKIERHIRSSKKRLPYKVICSDDTGFLTLVFFHANEDYLCRILPKGEICVISGRIEIYGDEIQMPHPDHIAPLSELEKLQTVEAIYPLTAGLPLKTVNKAIQEALKLLPEMPEWLDASLIIREKWPTWNVAVHKVHTPESVDDLTPSHPARRRLAYDELLANQLALSLVRSNVRKAKGRKIKGNNRLRGRILDILSFSLTNAQIRVSKEIATDMASKSRMLRLIQGDVGSGKTIVALLAMLNAVEIGSQTVLMAPTELLSRQHLATIQPLAKAIGVKVQLLTGREKGENRQTILKDLASGEAHIAIGTHALFQDDVTFHDLGLVVIDEQHRFGVHQRLTLASKGHAVDVLVMTATPIPRTLMLTAYGDMDVSRLDEKPPGRRSVDTRVLPTTRLEDVVIGIQRIINTTQSRVYWVCPLIAESETSDLAAAEARYEHLSRLFGKRVALLHSRMKNKEKDTVMAAFTKGCIDILVATTVVEVGVDIPEATVMIIEHAERFGLAQLHQLRGRIGRGTDQSSCLLLYASPLTGNARKRLEILRKTDDGFRIAEEDLKLRGAGELLGTRQSGLPEFKLADLSAHSDLLSMACNNAKLIIEQDPELTSQQGHALRILLYLFERDTAVRFLRSG